MRTILALAFVLAVAAEAAPFLPTKRGYDVSHYKIRLTIDPAKAGDRFTAEATIRLKPQGTLPLVALDVDDLDVHRVEVIAPEKRPLGFRTVAGKTLNIVLPEKLARAKELTLRIDYDGAIRSSHDGFFRVVDPDEHARGPLLFTHLEPLGARGVFPCNDQPFDKATTEVEATVPARYQVVSNGKLVAETKLKREGAPWHRVHWRQDKPHSTYLFALAIAPFKKAAATHNGKEVAVWVGETKVDRVKYVVSSTVKAMEYYEQYLGVPYPWAKYSIVGLPTFLWGGMENTSATFQNQDRSVLTERDSAAEKRRIVALSAHELAHQWFGDLVTMQWWDDVWLNESFATYMEVKASANIFNNEQSTVDFVTETWDSYFRQEDGPRSHPIVDKELTGADDAFDSINYVKGGNVLRMLEFYVGNDAFRRGLKGYLTKHAYGNATNRDFFAAIERASGEDLSAFRDSWVLRRGYPIVTWKGSWNNETRRYTIAFKQRPNHAEDSTVFRFRMPVAFHRKAAPAYDRAMTVEMGTVMPLDLSLELPAAPEWVTVNPGGVALAKVEQAEPDEAALVAQAAGDPDTLGRVAAAYALAAPLKEGAALTSTAEKALGTMLRTDRSPYARLALLDLFQKMKAPRLPQPLGDTVLELARAATGKGFETSDRYLSDPQGWRQWRSEIVGTLGKVDRAEALPLLAGLLGRPDLPLDDVQSAAFAVAKRGDDRSPSVLKEALKVHKKRAYRYEYWILYAYGAYESPKAAAELREIAKTGASDLFGRIGSAIRDNQTLKSSPEWAAWLTEFVLENERLGEEVKARLLETIEEVKTEPVRSAMEAILKESKSERMRELARKVLEKNFPASAADKA